MKPEQLRFAKSHEWLHVESPQAGQTATLGITPFAVELLTDLVYLELPKTGRTVKAGESLAEIESVKAVSDIYSPVAGEIVAVNDKLKDQLELFSSEAYGAAWIVKIKIADPAGLAGLMDFAAYQKHCQDEH